MSDDRETNARPAKRARLDDSAAHTPSTAVTPQATPGSALNAPSQIETDYDREVRAGIAEYICPNNLGFTGVLKQRYTDFLVNEIGLNGQVLHLKSTQVEKKKKKDVRAEAPAESEEVKPEEKIEIREEYGANAAPAAPKEEKPVEAEPAAKAEETNDGEETFAIADAPKKEVKEELSEEDTKLLYSIFGEDTTKQIVALVQSIRNREEAKARTFKAVTSAPILDKETRTNAHKSLRRMFPNLLETSMESDQSIRIKANPPAERKSKGGRGDKANGDQGKHRGGQLAWEELGGEYLHFSLYKENKDTMEVVGFLGSKLNSGAKAFAFAGTKDRRACTVQRLCVKRQTAERIAGFNRSLFNAAVGDFEYRKNDLKLGDLMGNEFTITLRDCKFQNEEGMNAIQRQAFANDVVGKAIRDFSEKGFINYYGLQRFGSFAASTDQVGRKMLQDDLKGAVDDLLNYSEVALAAAEGTSNSNILVSQDDRNRAKALHLWRTEGKGPAALELLPRKFTAERNIIQHLSSRNSKSGRHDRKADWQGALMTIPRTLRLMYVHAYQSLVWNVVAGKRWATHGDKVVAGDLVLVNEHLDKTGNASSTANTAIDQDGEFIINPSGTENANAVAEDFERARALTNTEAESGQYTVYDVVLPQPGFDVEYPKNSIGEFYKEFMGSERGGGLDPHNMRRSWREVSLSGGYRKFLAKPLRPLEFEVHSYTKEDQQFVETDLDKIKKARGGAKEGERESGDVTMEEGEEEEKKIAVVVKLQLGSSQYATMALRELMKAGGVKAYKPEFMGGR
ncbi:pseudouridine synthase-like protein TruD/Pus7 [Macroventuria anomochaeta]|uniref:Pseudouridine synthase-like protein TruD/Pus7 n=1 Tax=Macroventuria anomochaeta TaxID=301207 RepID=A0ACB6RSC9_9PLEO|nr:pseudouridine synthase-like protein TruD/Pus7 [Macroventuria anomochaeta]KAF2624951.1 pseudouridine synthase-like protein TruD/Pus7 [Macroventuria anomochaeta]